MSELGKMKTSDSELENQELIYERNSFNFNCAEDQTLHGMFEDQALRTPYSIALIMSDESMTFQELNSKSNLVCDFLLNCGVVKGAVVAIALPRSFDFIACCLGIMKTGAAYLVLDTQQPIARVEQIVANSTSRLVISTQSFSARLSAHSSVPILYIECLSTTIPFTLPSSIPSYTCDGVACIFYTSGSTGKPKGVVMLHRAILNRQLAIWDHVPHLEGEVGCQRANTTFITSLSEIFSNLLLGVSLVLVPDEVSQDLLQQSAYLRQHAVTRIFMVPSLLNALLSSDVTQDSLPLLKTWVTAGEPITSSVVTICTGMSSSPLLTR